MDISEIGGWVILELMGHRRLAGTMTEVELAGGKFLRLDSPGPDGVYATQFYAPAAVYCITPTTEEIARNVAASSQPAPVQRWELPALDARPLIATDDEEIPF